MEIEHFKFPSNSSIKGGDHVAAPMPPAVPPFRPRSTGAAFPMSFASSGQETNPQETSFVQREQQAGDISPGPHGNDHSPEVQEFSRCVPSEMWRRVLVDRFVVPAYTSRDADVFWRKHGHFRKGRVMSSAGAKTLGS